MAVSCKYRFCTLGSLFVFILLLGLGGVDCSGDNTTGIWLRITSLKITIDKVDLRIYSEDSAQGEPIQTQSITLSETKVLDPESENPENQLWVLINAGQTYKDKAISIQATGLRKSREVAYGSIEGLQFIPDKIVEAPQTLDLTHSGSDDDLDGFYVPDDCDDSDPSVNPEAEETCNDGLDNNCNGTTDEGCPCESGTEQECWPHWAGEIKGGPCVPGTQKCNGTWGPCEDLVLPNPEACPDGSYDCFSCANHADDDCDGFVDEKDTDCGGCVVDTWEPCYTGPEGSANVGICTFGQKHCIDGTWDMCEGEVLPKGCVPPEKPGQKADCSNMSEANLCDGRDNDCDGEIDNVTIKPTCSMACGVCAGAEQRCGTKEDGTPGWIDCSDTDYLNYASDPANIAKCSEQNPPPCCGLEAGCYSTQETMANCDGLDNDCDCVVDNAVDGECTCNNGMELRCPDLDDPLQGICKRGTTVCENGGWVDHDCQRPENEICDNLDNNCDGTVDQHPDASADCMQYKKAHTKNDVNCIEGICRWNCEDGYWDLNKDRNQPGGSNEGDGCEYECNLDNPANELCDGRDNDCDGLTDGDDVVNLDVLCPTRPHSNRTECEGPFDCDYTCVDPFEDCNGDLDWQVSTNYSGDGCEKNLSSDPNNCGACNNSCGSGESCSARVCSCGGTGPDCDDTPSDLCCGTQCVNTLDDTDHCGDCNTVCTNDHGSTDCVSGNCTPSCDPGYGDCDNNPDNGCEAYLWYTTSCGSSCFNRKNCSNEIQNASGATCDSGSCNYTLCSSSFADCDSNRTNGCEENIWERVDCGTNCNNRVDCSTQVQHANGKDCSSGHCSYSSCQAGFDNCDSNTENGCEENIWETADCGTNCNNRVNCSSTVFHASGLMCSSGHCDYTECSSGYADCDGDRSNGCEENIWETADCGTTCQNRHNCNNDVANASGVFCDSGSCNYSSCSSSRYGDCTGGRSDGCETDLYNTTDHCGNCAIACVNPNGNTSCSSGTCAPVCNNGSADCDGDPINGCEENIWETADCGTNCGNRVNCTTQIQNANGAFCSSGACDYSGCSNGYENCNNDRSDGCERNIWQATSCSTDCSPGVDCTTTLQNAEVITCASGSCSYGNCSNGYGDCDSNPANGCEEDIWQTSNCGMNCTTVDCNAQVQHATGINCPDGTCDYSSCGSSQWGDCDTDVTNGCEKNLWQDTDCGTNCTDGVDCSTQVLHATGASCSTGFCTYTSCINSQYGDCNTDETDGCELDLYGDSTCGADCGSVVDCFSEVIHALNPHCATGSCDYDSCAGPWDDCNADPTDGCEADLTADSRCGSCSNDCTGNAYNKACVYITDSYVCGCNNNSDCGASNPTCNAGQCE